MKEKNATVYTKQQELIESPRSQRKRLKEELALAQADLQQAQVRDLSPRSRAVDQRKAIQTVFCTLDADGNGTLDLKEMRQFDGLSDATVSAMFSEMDVAASAADGMFAGLQVRGQSDGIVSLTEWSAYWEEAAEMSSWDEVQKLLGLLVFRKYQPPAYKPLTEKQIRERQKKKFEGKARAVFDKIDTNGDKVLSSQEVWQWALENEKAAEDFFPSMFVQSSFGLSGVSKLKDEESFQSDFELDNFYNGNDANMDGKYDEDEFVARYVKYMCRKLDELKISEPTAEAWNAMWEKKADQKVTSRQQQLGLPENCVDGDERAYLRKVFTILDKDSNGYLTLAELKAGGDTLDPEAQTAYFEAMDALGKQDEKVSLDEFLSFWESAVKSLGWADVKKLVGELVQKRTSPSKAEMQTAFCSKAELVFSTIDKDKDDLLTHAELVSWAQKNPKAARAFLPEIEVLEDEWRFSGWLLQNEADDSVDGALDRAEFVELYSSSLMHEVMKTD